MWENITEMYRGYSRVYGTNEYQIAESQIAEYHIAESILPNPILPTFVKNDKVS